ncbi:Gfo/Idh/MocA family protein [Neoroseomonas oryzicola]|uniref:Gfo/Idh/MocA family oxidoreductase n=1 Tax=Neoroseomonas oryzicola TaxID=535904 RepID=A0A9X9WGZ0_9PROT|nr:Gfo/Idh/MocA family oxidoreductase [Neoroseomonas oryzicola]MBR0659600.1 Gfo/Idh/MocA family oxidoreductase [Neoroseomonas oryzicola]NKE15539.1 Gfo/Idh/MocA family oxidoreductase [Neoroseomonas oryzicola]
MSATDPRLALGILGVGHFGRFHALKAAANPRVRLAGLHDADPARVAAVAAETGTIPLDAAALVAASDAVIVAAPTRFHFDLAEAALAAGKHVFIEKPIAATLVEADALIALAARQGRLLQVGHIERFSAAFRAVTGAPAGGRALSWDAVRAAPFRPRSLDVSVVLDLMIHDIDLVLELAGGEPEAIEAVGSAVASEHPDFAVARLRFAGGRAAVLTASRVSLAMERRLRVLGTEGEMSVNFLDRSLAVLRRGGAEPVATMPGSGIDRATWTDHDSLEAEQIAFVAACLDGAPVVVDGAAGRRALKVALAVEAAIRAG